MADIKTQREIEESLKRQKEALKDMVIDSKEYLAAQKEILKLEEQKKNATYKTQDSVNDVAKSVADLAKAQKIANVAIKTGGDLSKTLGTFLKINVDTALKSKSLTAETNNIVKNRVKTIQNLAKLNSKDLSHQQKLELHQQSISDIESDLARSRNKKGQFQKGFNNLVVQALKTDKAALETKSKDLAVQAEGEKILESLVEKAKAFAEAITVGAIFAQAVSIAKKFGASIDKIGETFGSLNVMGKDFQQDLLRSSVDATKLGGGMEDVADITNTLGSDFGLSVDAAAELSGKVFDTSKAIGLSAGESANLFGTLMQTANLSAEQAESLAEGAYQLARQNGVAPSAVMKDIAGSAEEIAQFTMDGGDNIAEAAVQARKMGLSLSTTAKIADGLLDFESSIAKEVEASVLIGKQLNFQKARELALNNDIAGATKAIVDQLGSEEEFNKLNAIQRKAMADSIGVSVSEMSKMVGQSDKLSLSGAMAGKSFEDLLGAEGISNITQLTNQFAALGVVLTNSLGPVFSTLIGILNPVLGIFGSFIEKLEKMGALAPIITAAVAGLGAAYLTMKAAALQAAAAQLRQNIATAGGIGKLIMKTISTFFSAAASGSASTLGFGTPVMVGLAVAAIAALWASLSKAKSVKDFHSGPGGINYMSGPAGAFTLNPKDSVLATTNPIQVNDIMTGPAGSIKPVNDLISTPSGVTPAPNMPRNMNLNINLKARQDQLVGVMDANNAGGQANYGNFAKPRFTS